MFFIFTYDHWETTFSPFAKLVTTYSKLVFDSLTLLISMTSTNERTAEKLKAINKTSFAALVMKPFQGYMNVTVELQLYLTFYGNKLM